MSSSELGLLEKALEAHERGDVGLAIDALEQVLASDPSDARLWAWMGDLYSEREQYVAAREAFENALELNPDSAKAAIGLGVALQSVNHLEEAEVALRRGVELSGESYSLVLLADVLSGLGRVEEAQQLLQDVLNVEPANEEALYNLGVLYRRVRPEIAANLFSDAIQIDSANGEAHRELGFCLFSLDRLEEAKGALEASIELNERDGWARVYLAMVFRNLGDDDAAEMELRRASETSPLWNLPHRRRGEIYADSGRWVEAEVCYKEAVMLDERDAGAVAELGRFLLDTGRPKEARRWIDSALCLDPMQPIALEMKRRSQGFE
jgi:protein O-GlcNAc transferase